MHADERQDFAGLSSGVLDNEITPIGLVCNMVDDKWAATGGGAEWAEDVEHVPDDPVLLRDEVWGVVLHVLRFADELGQEGHEGVLVKVS